MQLARADWEDSSALDDFAWASSSVLQSPCWTANHRYILISKCKLPWLTSQWSEKCFCRSILETSCLTTDSIICSKFCNSKVPKKTITKLQFMLEKQKTECVPCFTALSYRLKNGRNISFGKRLLEDGTMQRICALTEILFTLTEYGIELENPSFTFSLKWI